MDPPVVQLVSYTYTSFTLPRKQSVGSLVSPQHLSSAVPWSTYMNLLQKKSAEQVHLQ